MDAQDDWWCTDCNDLVGRRSPSCRVGYHPCLRLLPALKRELSKAAGRLEELLDAEGGGIGPEATHRARAALELLRRPALECRLTVDHNPGGDVDSHFAAEWQVSPPGRDGQDDSRDSVTRMFVAYLAARGSLAECEGPGPGHRWSDFEAEEHSLRLKNEEGEVEAESGSETDDDSAPRVLVNLAVLDSAGVMDVRRSADERPDTSSALHVGTVVNDVEEDDDIQTVWANIKRSDSDIESATFRSIPPLTVGHSTLHDEDTGLQFSEDGRSSTTSFQAADADQDHLAGLGPPEERLPLLPVKVESPDSETEEVALDDGPIANTTIYDNLEDAEEVDERPVTNTPQPGADDPPDPPVDLPSSQPDADLPTAGFDGCASPRSDRVEISDVFAWRLEAKQLSTERLEVVVTGEEGLNILKEKLESNRWPNLKWVLLVREGNKCSAEDCSGDLASVKSVASDNVDVMCVQCIRFPTRPRMMNTISMAGPGERQRDKDNCKKWLQCIHVPKLVGLNCKRDPAWSLELLQIAKRQMELERVEVMWPRREHFDLVVEMHQLLTLEIYADDALYKNPPWVQPTASCHIRCLQVEGLHADTFESLLQAHHSTLTQIHVLVDPPDVTTIPETRDLKDTEGGRPLKSIDFQRLMKETKLENLSELIVDRTTPGEHQGGRGSACERQLEDLKALLPGVIVSCYRCSPPKKKRRSANSAENSGQPGRKRGKYNKK